MHRDRFIKILLLRSGMTKTCLDKELTFKGINNNDIEALTIFDSSGIPVYYSVRDKTSKKTEVYNTSDTDKYPDLYSMVSEKDSSLVSSNELIEIIKSKEGKRELDINTTRFNCETTLDELNKIYGDMPKKIECPKLPVKPIIEKKTQNPDEKSKYLKMKVIVHESY